MSECITRAAARKTTNGNFTRIRFRHRLGFRRRTKSGRPFIVDVYAVERLRMEAG